MTDHFQSSTFSPLQNLKTLAAALESELTLLRELRTRHSRHIDELLATYQSTSNDAEADIVWQERRTWIERLRVLDKDLDTVMTKLLSVNRKINA